MTSQLIKQLEKYGIKVIKRDSSFRVRLPDPVPPEAIPLLRQLKALHQSRRESWDEEAIIRLYVDMLARQNKRYPKGALEFVYSDRPGLVTALQAAEDEYTQAFHRQDMARCRQAISAIEKAISAIIEAFELENDLWPPGRD